MSMHANTRALSIMGLLPFDRNFTRPYNNETAWCERHLMNFTGIYNDNSTLSNSDHDGSKKTTMQLVFTVVLMALMGCTLCIDGFMRLFIPRFTYTLRLFLGRFNLEPIARILLHFAFFQFLPLLSSVFSRAEGQERTEVLLVLLWMLLVELIRKKVQGMLLSTSGSSFSRGIGRFTLMDYSDEVSRLVWVGFLIYTTLDRIHYHGLEFLAGAFVILWSLGLLKLVQRVVNTWLASGSWHTARNPLLIAAYMQHVMEDKRGPQEMVVGCSSSSAGGCDSMLSECKFAVMGEEKLVVRRNTSACRCSKQEGIQKKGWVARARATTTPGYGYGVGRRVVPAPHQNEQHHGPSYDYCDQNEQKHVHVHLIDHNETTEPHKAKKEEKGGLVTVGDIWKMHKTHKELFCGKRRRLLEDLCLSFSLFKMLRRRFEHYPMVEVGSAGTRNLMLQGLLNLVSDADDNRDDLHQRPFQVLQLELDILTNYYQQASAPVVMSQPILFFCNSVSSIIFLAIFITSVLYMLLRSKNAAILYCAAMGLVSKSHIYLFIYPAITILLLVTVLSIEAYEFWTLYVFSNWNIVRLLCSYSSTSGLRQKFYFIIIAARFCAHTIFCRWLTKTSIKVQQVSIVDACGALDRYSARTTAKVLPAQATPSIIDNLKGGVDPRTGVVRLPQLEGLRLHFHLGETTSTEIILACHLATELLEMTEHRPMSKVESEHKEVASVLSKYCMYLVAHVPQLLPDDETWVADRHEDVRSFLEEHASTCNCGCFILLCALTHDCRKENAMRILELGEEDLHEPTTRRALKLFRELQKRTAAMACNGRDRDDDVWKQLATFWVRLLIYLAPSNDVQGHAKVLATWGSDLMTCLWAFCTHAGITRQPLEDDTGAAAMCV